MGSENRRRLIASSQSFQKPKLGPDLIAYKLLNQLISDQTKRIFLVVGLRHHVAKVNVAALKGFFFLSRKKPLKILIQQRLFENKPKTLRFCHRFPTLITSGFQFRFLFVFRSTRVWYLLSVSPFFSIIF